MIEQTLYQKIDQITNEGYGSNNTRQALKEAAYRMEKAGWPDEMILELLQNIYAAMLSDFANAYHGRNDE